ncbi:MAG: ATP-binding protein [Candidatus Omnitrophica bacterium]|nr:ATP-binding protein [Candidatus Omnitrophota bacterium]
MSKLTQKLWFRLIAVVMAQVFVFTSVDLSVAAPIESLRPLARHCEPQAKQSVTHELAVSAPFAARLRQVLRESNLVGSVEPELSYSFAMLAAAAQKTEDEAAWQVARSWFGPSHKDDYLRFFEILRAKNLFDEKAEVRMWGLMVQPEISSFLANLVREISENRPSVIRYQGDQELNYVTAGKFFTREVSIQEQYLDRFFREHHISAQISQAVWQEALNEWQKTDDYRGLPEELKRVFNDLPEKPALELAGALVNGLEQALAFRTVLTAQAAFDDQPGAASADAPAAVSAYAQKSMGPSDQFKPIDLADTLARDDATLLSRGQVQTLLQNLPLPSADPKDPRVQRIQKRINQNLWPGGTARGFAGGVRRMGMQIMRLRWGIGGVGVLAAAAGLAVVFAPAVLPVAALAAPVGLLGYVIIRGGNLWRAHRYNEKQRIEAAQRQYPDTQIGEDYRTRWSLSSYLRSQAPVLGLAVAGLGVAMALLAAPAAAPAVLIGLGILAVAAPLALQLPGLDGLRREARAWGVGEDQSAVPVYQVPLVSGEELAYHGMVGGKSVIVVNASRSEAEQAEAIHRELAELAWVARLGGRSPGAWLRRRKIKGLARAHQKELSTRLEQAGAQALQSPEVTRLKANLERLEQELALQGDEWVELWAHRLGAEVHTRDFGVSAYTLHEWERLAQGHREGNTEDLAWLLQEDRSLHHAVAQAMLGRIEDQELLRYENSNQKVWASVLAKRPWTPIQNLLSASLEDQIASAWYLDWNLGQGTEIGNPEAARAFLQHCLQGPPALAAPAVRAYANFVRQHPPSSWQSLAQEIQILGHLINGEPGQHEQLPSQELREQAFSALEVLAIQAVQLIRNYSSDTELRTADKAAQADPVLLLVRVLRDIQMKSAGGKLAPEESQTIREKSVELLGSLAMALDSHATTSPGGVTLSELRPKNAPQARAEIIETLELLATFEVNITPEGRHEDKPLRMPAIQTLASVLHGENPPPAKLEQLWIEAEERRLGGPQRVVWGDFSAVPDAAAESLARSQQEIQDLFLDHPMVKSESSVFSEFQEGLWPQAQGWRLRPGLRRVSSVLGRLGLRTGTALLVGTALVASGFLVAVSASLALALLTALGVMVFGITFAVQLITKDWAGAGKTLWTAGAVGAGILLAPVGVIALCFGISALGFSTFALVDKGYQKAPAVHWGTHPNGLKGGPLFIGKDPVTSQDVIVLNKAYEGQTELIAEALYREGRRQHWLRTLRSDPGRLQFAAVSEDWQSVEEAAGVLADADLYAQFGLGAYRRKQLRDWERYPQIARAMQRKMNGEKNRNEALYRVFLGWDAELGKRGNAAASMESKMAWLCGVVAGEVAWQDVMDKRGDLSWIPVSIWAAGSLLRKERFTLEQIRFRDYDSLFGVPVQGPPGGIPMAEEIRGRMTGDTIPLSDLRGLIGSDNLNDLKMQGHEKARMIGDAAEAATQLAVHRVLNNQWTDPALAPAQQGVPVLSSLGSRLNINPHTEIVPSFLDATGPNPEVRHLARILGSSGLPESLRKQALDGLKETGLMLNLRQQMLNPGTTDLRSALASHQMILEALASGYGTSLDAEAVAAIAELAGMPLAVGLHWDQISRDPKVLGEVLKASVGQEEWNRRENLIRSRMSNAPPDDVTRKIVRSLMRSHPFAVVRAVLSGRAQEVAAEGVLGTRLKHAVAVLSYAGSPTAFAAMARLVGKDDVVRSWKAWNSATTGARIWAAGEDPVQQAKAASDAQERQGRVANGIGAMQNGGLMWHGKAQGAQSKAFHPYVGPVSLPGKGAVRPLSSPGGWSLYPADAKDPARGKAKVKPSPGYALSQGDPICAELEKVFNEIADTLGRNSQAAIAVGRVSAGLASVRAIRFFEESGFNSERKPVHVLLAQEGEDQVLYVNSAAASVGTLLTWDSSTRKWGSAINQDQLRNLAYALVANVDWLWPEPAQDATPIRWDTAKLMSVRGVEDSELPANLQAQLNSASPLTGEDTQELFAPILSKNTPRTGLIAKHIQRATRPSPLSRLAAFLVSPLDISAGFLAYYAGVARRRWDQGPASPEEEHQTGMAAVGRVKSSTAPALERAQASGLAGFHAWVTQRRVFVAAGAALAAGVALVAGIQLAPALSVGLMVLGLSRIFAPVIASRLGEIEVPEVKVGEQWAAGRAAISQDFARERQATAGAAREARAEWAAARAEIDAALKPFRQWLSERAKSLAGIKAVQTLLVPVRVVRRIVRLILSRPVRLGSLGFAAGLAVGAAALSAGGLSLAVVAVPLVLVSPFLVHLALGLARLVLRHPARSAVILGVPVAGIAGLGIALSAGAGLAAGAAMGVAAAGVVLVVPVVVMGLRRVFRPVFRAMGRRAGSGISSAVDRVNGRGTTLWGLLRGAAGSLFENLVRPYEGKLLRDARLYQGLAVFGVGFVAFGVAVSVPLATTIVGAVGLSLVAAAVFVGAARVWLRFSPRRYYNFRQVPIYRADLGNRGEKGPPAAYMQVQLQGQTQPQWVLAINTRYDDQPAVQSAAAYQDLREIYWRERFAQHRFRILNGHLSLGRKLKLARWNAVTALHDANLRGIAGLFAGFAMRVLAGSWFKAPDFDHATNLLRKIEEDERHLAHVLGAGERVLAEGNKGKKSMASSEVSAALQDVDGRNELIEEYLKGSRGFHHKAYRRYLGAKAARAIQAHEAKVQEILVAAVNREQKLASGLATAAMGKIYASVDSQTLHTGRVSVDENGYLKDAETWDPLWVRKPGMNERIQARVTEDQTDKLTQRQADELARQLEQPLAELERQFQDIGPEAATRVREFLGIIRQSGAQVHLIQDNENIRGFVDEDGIVWISKRLATHPIAFFHEFLIEGYFRDVNLPEGLNPHTLGRGAGKDLRNLFDQNAPAWSSLSAEDLVAALETALSQNPIEKADGSTRTLTDAEKALIRYNAARGKTGRELLYGIQDEIFGPEANEAFTEELRIWAEVLRLHGDDPLDPYATFLDIYAHWRDYPQFSYAAMRNIYIRENERRGYQDPYQDGFDPKAAGAGADRYPPPNSGPSSAFMGKSYDPEGGLYDRGGVQRQSTGVSNEYTLLDADGAELRDGPGAASSPIRVRDVVDSQGRAQTVQLGQGILGTMESLRISKLHTDGVISRELADYIRGFNASGREIQLIEDNGNARGFWELTASQPVPALDNPVSLTPQAAFHPSGIGPFHEALELYGAVNPNDRPQDMPDAVTNHTRWRGVGQDVRDAHDTNEGMERARNLPDFLNALEAECVRRLTASEEGLITFNWNLGVRGRALLYGIQDEIFGPEANEAFTREMDTWAGEALLRAQYEWASEDLQAQLTEKLVSPAILVPWVRDMTARIHKYNRTIRQMPQQNRQPIDIPDFIDVFLENAEVNPDVLSWACYRMEAEGLLRPGAIGTQNLHNEAVLKRAVTKGLLAQIGRLSDSLRSDGGVGYLISYDSLITAVHHLCNVQNIHGSPEQACVVLSGVLSGEQEVSALSGEVPVRMPGRSLGIQASAARTTPSLSLPLLLREIAQAAPDSPQLLALRQALTDPASLRVWHDYFMGEIGSTSGISDADILIETASVFSYQPIGESPKDRVPLAMMHELEKLGALSGAANINDPEYFWVGLAQDILLPGLKAVFSQKPGSPRLDFESMESLTKSIQAWLTDGQGGGGEVSWETALASCSGELTLRQVSELPDWVAEEGNTGIGPGTAFAAYTYYIRLGGLPRALGDEIQSGAVALQLVSDSDYPVVLGGVDVLQESLLSRVVLEEAPNNTCNILLPFKAGNPPNYETASLRVLSNRNSTPSSRTILATKSVRLQIDGQGGGGSLKYWDDLSRAAIELHQVWGLEQVVSWQTAVDGGAHSEALCEALTSPDVLYRLVSLVRGSEYTSYHSDGDQAVDSAFRSLGPTMRDLRLPVMEGGDLAAKRQGLALLVVCYIGIRDSMESEGGNLSVEARAFRAALLDSLGLGEESFGGILRTVHERLKTDPPLAEEPPSAEAPQSWAKRLDRAYLAASQQNRIGFADVLAGVPSLLGFASEREAAVTSDIQAAGLNAIVDYLLRQKQLSLPYGKTSLHVAYALIEHIEEVLDNPPSSSRWLDSLYESLQIPAHQRSPQLAGERLLGILTGDGQGGGLSPAQVLGKVVAVRENAVVILGKILEVETNKQAEFARYLDNPLLNPRAGLARAIGAETSLNDEQLGLALVEYLLQHHHIQAIGLVIKAGGLSLGQLIHVSGRYAPGLLSLYAGQTPYLQIANAEFWARILPQDAQVVISIPTRRIRMQWPAGDLRFRQGNAPRGTLIENGNLLLDISSLLQAASQGALAITVEIKGPDGVVLWQEQRWLSHSGGRLNLAASSEGGALKDIGVWNQQELRTYDLNSLLSGAAPIAQEELRKLLDQGSHAIPAEKRSAALDQLEEGLQSLPVYITDLGEDGPPAYEGLLRDPLSGSSSRVVVLNSARRDPALRLEALYHEVQEVKWIQTLGSRLEELRQEPFAQELISELKGQYPNGDVLDGRLLERLAHRLASAEQAALFGFSTFVTGQMEGWIQGLAVDPYFLSPLINEGIGEGRASHKGLRNWAVQAGLMPETAAAAAETHENELHEFMLSLAGVRIQLPELSPGEFLVVAAHLVDAARWQPGYSKDAAQYRNRMLYLVLERAAMAAQAMDARYEEIYELIDEFEQAIPSDALNKEAREFLDPLRDTRSAYSFAPGAGQGYWQTQVAPQLQLLRDLAQGGELAQLAEGVDVRQLTHDLVNQATRQFGSPSFSYQIVDGGNTLNVQGPSLPFIARETVWEFLTNAWKYGSSTGPGDPKNVDVSLDNAILPLVLLGATVDDRISVPSEGLARGPWEAKMLRGGVSDAELAIERRITNRGSAAVVVQAELVYVEGGTEQVLSRGDPVSISPQSVEGVRVPWVLDYKEIQQKLGRGSVVLRLRQVDAGQADLDGLLCESNALEFRPVVAVSVKDQGPGLAQKSLDELRFFPLGWRAPENQETAKGTGRGLHSIHELVTASGGHLHVDSHEGGAGSGTRFTGYFPVQGKPVGLEVLMDLVEAVFHRAKNAGMLPMTYAEFARQELEIQVSGEVFQKISGLEERIAALAVDASGPLYMSGIHMFLGDRATRLQSMLEKCEELGIRPRVLIENFMRDEDPAQAFADALVAEMRTGTQINPREIKERKQALLNAVRLRWDEGSSQRQLFESLLESGVTLDRADGESMQVLVEYSDASDFSARAETTRLAFSHYDSVWMTDSSRERKAVRVIKIVLANDSDALAVLDELLREMLRFEGIPSAINIPGLRPRLSGGLGKAAASRLLGLELPRDVERSLTEIVRTADPVKARLLMDSLEREWHPAWTVEPLSGEHEELRKFVEPVVRAVNARIALARQVLNGEKTLDDWHAAAATPLPDATGTLTDAAFATVDLTSAL